jgi:predicted dehydrogenase
VTAALRVGIVGARRRRRGLGPFVARDLRAAGAEIAGFLATSPATRDATARALSAPGYLDLDAMLAAEPLDALAVLSPAETHARYLEAACAAGLHVLSEKPLVWGEPGLARIAARIAVAFDARGLLLWENCPWPYALPALEALHPGATARAPRRFEMRLQPASRGVAMLGDAMPHVFSLLQALNPGDKPAVLEPRFSRRDAAADELVVRFVYRSDAAATRVRATLVRTEAVPSRAVLAVDGRVAQRVVSPDDYRLAFADGDRSVPVPDPLTLLVADFVRALEAGRAASRSREIVQRMALLETLVAAYGA